MKEHVLLGRECLDKVSLCCQFLNTSILPVRYEEFSPVCHYVMRDLELYWASSW